MVSLGRIQPKQQEYGADFCDQAIDRGKNTNYPLDNSENWDKKSMENLEVLEEFAGVESTAVKNMAI